MNMNKIYHNLKIRNKSIYKNIYLYKTKYKYVTKK